MAKLGAVVLDLTVALEARDSWLETLEERCVRGGRILHHRSAVVVKIWLLHGFVSELMSPGRTARAS